MRLRRLTPELQARHGAAAAAAVGPIAADAAERFITLGVQGVANGWLQRMPWKQTAAMLLYGDLLGTAPPRRVLEVGGGLSGLTLRLASTHDYTLVERSTHDDAEHYRRVEQYVGRPFVVVADWADVTPDPCDVVIAVDLFPNVDQRVCEFVERFLPRVDEMRLTLTYYEDTVFNVVREGSGEHLTIKPWGLRETRTFIEWLGDRYGITADADSADALRYDNYEGALFGNRRNVILLQVERPRG